jgi:hypothetical protein
MMPPVQEQLGGFLLVLAIMALVLGLLWLGQVGVV